MYTITMTVQYYYVSYNRNFQDNVKNNKERYYYKKIMCQIVFKRFIL